MASMKRFKYYRLLDENTGGLNIGCWPSSTTPANMIEAITERLNKLAVDEGIVKGSPAW
jgi:hypothetical protein